jgi:hypothetical protein
LTVVVVKSDATCDARYGTDDERAEQIERNLDNICPASSTEVEPND